MNDQKEKIDENIKKYLDILSKDFKEHNSVLLEEFKGHTSVLLEDFKGSVKIIAEQHSNMNGKIDLILEDIDGIKSDIVDMKSDIKEMKVELGMKANKEVVDNHETRIVKLEKASLASA
jgi:hypothetical protein